EADLPAYVFSVSFLPVSVPALLPAVPQHLQPPSSPPLRYPSDIPHLSPDSLSSSAQPLHSRRSDGPDGTIHAVPYATGSPEEADGLSLVQAGFRVLPSDNTGFAP